MRIQLLFTLFSLFFATNVYGTEVDIAIQAPPGIDTDSEVVAIPTADGGFIYVNKTEALSTSLSLATRYEVEDAVYFELYTKSNPTELQYLAINDTESLKNSSFNPNNPTKILVHGWRSTGELTTLFQEAFFKVGAKDINLIAVNWQYGASTLNYIVARQEVFAVGGLVAQFIDFLVREGGLKLESLQLIGHSLGAHVCGIAGKNVTSGKIPKIIGLDPAFPLFSLNKPGERLSEKDAKVVEIIHSNAGRLGFSSPLGHISFYPNGGASQPGCGWDLLNACAHSRSYIYYAESIHSPTGFYAWKCESYEKLQNGNCHVKDANDLIQMGADVNNNATGVYYLETNGNPTFAVGRNIKGLSLTTK